MTIEFPCPHCQQLVRTPDAAAGKKGKCPSCAGVVKIPVAAAPETRPPEQSAARPAKAGTPTKTAAVGPEVQPTEDMGPIEFFCPSCGQVVRTPRAAAGKKGKCPHCAEVVQIPLTNKLKPKSPVANKPQPAPQTQPTPKTTPERTLAPAPVKEDIGLAPLDDLPPLPEPKPKPQRKPALRPLPPEMEPAWQQPAAPQTPGLTPLGPIAPLQPAAPLQPLAPLAPLAPLGSDPLGGVAAGNFFGAGVPAADPFGGLTPLGPAPGHDPFGAVPAGIPPPSAFGGTSGHSLAPAPISSYQAPVASHSDPGTSLILPAVFQLIVSVPIALATLGMTLLIVMATIVAVAEVTGSGGKLNETGMIIRLAYIIGGVIAVICQLVVVFGSIKQLQRREYDQVMTANWMSLIVCILPFSFPFGIWSLILLHQDNVRRSFRRS